MVSSEMILVESCTISAACVQPITDLTSQCKENGATGLYVCPAIRAVKYKSLGKQTIGSPNDDVEMSQATG